MEESSKVYSNIVMLYADHVMRGIRTIESVPLSIRPQVAACIADTMGE